MLGTCDVFRKDSINQRRKLLQEKKLCPMCARPHVGKCSATCRKCKGRHSEIMCEKGAA